MRLIDIEPGIKQLWLDIEHLHSIANELRGTEHEICCAEICCAEDIVKTESQIQWLKSFPIIDPESLRPTAHWITDSGGGTNVACSAYNAISFAAYNFCPECGARMVNADD